MADSEARTILLVEDEEIEVELIRRIFEDNSLNWEVFHVSNVKEALKWLDENKSPSLIIADYFLPDGSGLDLLKEVMGREKGEIAPLIIMTKHSTEQLAVRSLKSGAIDYVVKSVKELRNLPWTAKRALHEWGQVVKLKQAEEEVKEYMKELERANRDLADFAHTVSHDLKAPLRSVQAFTTLILEDYGDTLDERMREYLEKVRDAGERMSALIKDILTLSRVGRGSIEVETVDLNELLEEVKTDLKAIIEERGGKVVAEELPSISTQRVWIKELLMNLIDNGLKFNRSGKPMVEVSYEEREREKEYLFKIKDNGIGIEEEYQSRIFNLSERLHPREYEGTGFGLNICQKIVDKLGGNIRVESKPGEGSTFFFSIPKEK
uniref:histidine kinase n=1 Tax=Candidatus Methanophagaceae archaeon ANME-1 ERB6 TaxID=2759912 RepID=A0A7G9YXP8_9EURY|nr:adaptive-response sensory-kinase SasA [Methanosarcinales archaeon ANME-1 ERB6]